MADDATTYDFLDPPGREGEIGRLGPYRVLRVIGKGGMGQVFAAHDARLKREVALKLMNPKIGTTNQTRKRFIEEARSMAAVHHDNVATIFEVGVHGNMPFIAMEILQGDPLNIVLQRRKRLPWREVIRLAREVATGLQAAHRRGIIHRDIKPGNLWIQEPSGRAKILDFGLAIANPELDGLAPRGATVGSPGYLSPEQARNDPVDDRTDLYSLGVVLYQACAGRLPLRTDSIVAQMVANICAIPRPLSEASPETPQPLCDLVDRLLHKEPRHRPRSASHLIDLCDIVEEQCETDQRIELEISTYPPERSSRSRRAKKPEQLTNRDSEDRDATIASNSKGSIVTSFMSLLDSATFRQKVTVIAAVAVALVLIISAITWFSAGDDPTAPFNASNSPRPVAATASGDVPAANQPTVITASSLQPLSLSELSGTESLTVGQAARYELQLSNRAESAATDPRRVHAGEEIVAQIVTLLKPVNGSDVQRPAFPQKLRPRQLPSAGKTKMIPMQFLTGGLMPGNYDVTFELQTPTGIAVSRSESIMEVKPKPDTEKPEAKQPGKASP